MTGLINDKAKDQSDTSCTDPKNYSEAVGGNDSKGWIESIREECLSLQDHDVFEWVDPPEDKDVKPIPSKFIFKWKYDKEGKPVRQKSRIVVQGLSLIHI